MGTRMGLAAIAVGLLLAGCGYDAAARARGWRIIETENVRLRTSSPSRQFVDLAADLQRVRDVMAATVLRCGFRQERERTEIVASSRADLRDLGVSERGVYWAVRWSWIDELTGNILLAEGQERNGTSTFAHELTHSLLYARAPAAPLWVHEGLASLLQAVGLHAPAPGPVGAA